MTLRVLDFFDGYSSVSAPSSANATGLYEAIISSGGEAFATHSSWSAYLAGSPADGDRILVLTGEELDSTVTLSNSDLSIVIKPGVVYTKGTATTAFTLSGDRISWDGGRFSGFNAGSDVGLNITGDYNHISKAWFNDVDTNISDTGTANFILGVIDETP